MYKQYFLEKPDIASIKDSTLFEFIGKTKQEELFEQIIKTASYPEYLHWDKIKYKKFPLDESVEIIWAAIKLIRSVSNSKTVIKNEKEIFFKWNPYLYGLNKKLNKIDLNTGGYLGGKNSAMDEKNKLKFISSGIMEEAIASSQLEGASTTRKLAKKFLAENRKPKTHAEKMIFNNYIAMKQIEETFKYEKLSLDLFFEMHALIVKDTIKKEELFAFRKDKDDIIVLDRNGQSIYHIPPKIDFVKKEFESFIKFANDDLEEDFIHPIIKAIMLHFWIGYLHPFTDGNGRCARLIFYWYLLRKGYWAFAYLPISTIIKKSPAQYSKAYIYSEQDDLDLTYFIDYNIRKILMAVDDFERYKEKIITKNKKINIISKNHYKFNERQIQLIKYYYRNKNEYTTPTTHKNIYQISIATTIRDLQELLQKGFVTMKKQGKQALYFATDKINELFHK